MPVLITAICSSSKLFQSTIPCNLILTFYGNTSKSGVGIIGREKNTEYKSRFPLLPGISLPEPRMSNDLILPHSLQPAHMSFSIQYQTCRINESMCNINIKLPILRESLQILSKELIGKMPSEMKVAPFHNLSTLLTLLLRRVMYAYIHISLIDN